MHSKEWPNNCVEQSRGKIYFFLTTAITTTHYLTLIGVAPLSFGAAKVCFAGYLIVYKSDFGSSHFFCFAAFGSAIIFKICKVSICGVFLVHRRAEKYQSR